MARASHKTDKSRSQIQHTEKRIQTERSNLPTPRHSYYTMYRAPFNNPWQTKGETMSLNSACETYGITEQQARDAKLECRWRSHFGNYYAVVICADVRALQQKLVKREEQAKENYLVKTYGAEKVDKMKKAEKDKKQIAKAATDAAREGEYKKFSIKSHMGKIVELLSGSDDVQSSSSDINVKVAKTTAKKDWFLADHEIARLTSVADGRATKYNLSDIIQRAEGKHHVHRLKEKLLKRGDAKTLAQYRAYRKQEIDKELAKYPQDLINEARSETIASLQKEMDASEQKVREAGQEAHKNENRIKEFELISFAGKAPLADITNDLKRNVSSKSSPSKKTKTIA